MFVLTRLLGSRTCVFSRIQIKWVAGLIIRIDQLLEVLIPRTAMHTTHE
jgi:hypothetical protein